MYPNSAPSPAHLACSILFKVPFKGPIFFERLPGLGMTKHWQNQPCPIWIELESPGYMKLWDTNGVNQTCHIFFICETLYIWFIFTTPSTLFFMSLRSTPIIVNALQVYLGGMSMGLLWLGTGRRLTIRTSWWTPSMQWEQLKWNINGKSPQNMALYGAVPPF